ncbi:MAG: 2-oxoglutarate synthase [marine bacterium B5-7]|nr:MAG: 2-oxoglutarate synthase [marine bacterium B5-7]
MEEHKDRASSSISIALIGSGGAGVMTAGSMLLEAAGRAGLFGIMTRSAGPQIRGGEAAAMLRLATFPVESHDNEFDILLAIDWLNADRFRAEIPLGTQSLIIGETDAEPPQAFTDSGARTLELPLKQIARETDGGRENMVVLGVVCSLIGLPLEPLHQVLESLLKRKGQAAIDSSVACVDSGAAHTGKHQGSYQLSLSSEKQCDLWNISGNEAAGLGAIRGGVRFVAAYPITPATELLEWMAPALEQVGGILVQAEDELASVNQLIGASFGGTPSLTATSGPGLALMTESIGLAVASETPIVVVDVMRGGPSTGIPTKSEQSDLNIAIYGLHGDAPHLVLAPMSVADCLFTTQWAIHLAEKLQTAAIVLSDQNLGQTRAIIERPADVAFVSGRSIQETPMEGYQRYAVGGNGVSPMALPGTAGCQYTADGLEHAPSGIPSSRAEDHRQQLDKRRDKLVNHDYGDHWALIEGEGEFAVITWGSSLAPVREARAMLLSDGIDIRIIAPRLLLPVQPERMQQALAGVTGALVVEQSHGAQFFHYLQAFYPQKFEFMSMAQPGPLPIRPEQVVADIKTRGKY